MENLIIVAVLIVIIGLSVRYMIKAKKRGEKCIGCPNGCCCCSSANSEGCSCGTQD
ncbi:MAG: FeoB-associated Cys-rich membrane protein [Oscillospiraceae bacterium]|nr:FeoB-associated Cys-rich membrane protein [Oscillospiraceae bacterium]